MRKLQQVALVIAAAGGLTAVGAGPSSAVTPAYNGAVPPPASQPDAQATSATSSAATAQSYGTPQQAPSRGTDVAPQLNPQLNPQINPQISPQTPQSVEGGPVGQANLFRPSQECSPQTLLGANVPVGLLGAAQTRGIDCSQANTQSNALANALHG